MKTNRFTKLVGYFGALLAVAVFAFYLGKKYQRDADQDAFPSKVEGYVAELREHIYFTKALSLETNVMTLRLAKSKELKGIEEFHRGLLDQNYEYLLKYKDDPRTSKFKETAILEAIERATALKPKSVTGAPK